LIKAEIHFDISQLHSIDTYLFTCSVAVETTSYNIQQLHLISVLSVFLYVCMQDLL